MSKKPIMLMILDGWGNRGDFSDNAIFAAKKPFYNSLLLKYPHSQLDASGEAVGLPAGQMGNSEVGHLNIGAGRVVYQELTRISKSIKDGDFFTNNILLKAVNLAKKNDKQLHLLGLLSNGGVHSSMDHIFALLDLAKAQGIKKVYVHALLDGRDVPPQSALIYLAELEKKMQEIELGEIASIAGRYYTMDRDKRWERIEKGYNVLVNDSGEKAFTAKEAVEKAYKIGLTDEFILPTAILNPDGNMIAKIEQNDSVIFFNFRADRARQISHVFTDKEFINFKREEAMLPVNFFCLTEYDVTLNCDVVFLPTGLHNTLGEILAKHKKHQLRIAETEKYAHVTFFFNGGVEEANPFETRILVASPKVATYDLKPEMSAFEVTDKTLTAIESDNFDVIILNFANPDMLGHTGNFSAAVQAVEVIDNCIQKIVSEMLEKDGIVLLTADHGNCEMMIDPVTGEPHTAHTTDFVPLIFIAKAAIGKEILDGALKDIAPTMLQLMKIPIPVEMTGKSLIVND
ncbi:MAG: 2,3-bisphosphoglycerate-independent phosphoglycerate mutase [Clostridia bacterium]